jgi:hypothetical protein
VPGGHFNRRAAPAQEQKMAEQDALETGQDGQKDAPKFFLPETLEDLSGLPAELQDYYVKPEGSDTYQRQNVKALKNALESEKDRRRKETKAKQEYAKRLEGVEDFDPEEYQRLREEHEKRALDEAEKKGEWEKLRQQMAKQNDEKLQKERSVSEKYRNALEGVMRDQQLTKELVGLGATEEGLDLLPLRLGTNIKVIEDDGQFKTVILGPDGTTPQVNAEGQPTTIAELAKQAREKYPALFKSSGASGSSASQNATSSGGAGTSYLSKPTSEWTTEQKTEFITKNGNDKWMELIRSELAG